MYLKPSSTYLFIFEELYYRSTLEKPMYVHELCFIDLSALFLKKKPIAQNHACKFFIALEHLFFFQDISIQRGGKRINKTVKYRDSIEDALNATFVTFKKRGNRGE